MTDIPAHPARNPVPEALLRLDLNTLVGQPVNSARTTVEELGGHFHVVVGGVSPANLDLRRVKFEVEHGCVSAVMPGLS